MKNITSYTMRDEHCVLRLPANYDLFWLIILILIALIGVFHTLFGYRFWRLTIFIPPFGISAWLFYAILSIPNTINPVLVVCISCLLAILIGLISVLVPYIGLFILGSCFGLILSVLTIFTCDLRNHIDDHQKLLRIDIGIITILTLLSAILTFRFQKFMLIIISSCLGGIYQMIVLDYLLQLSLLLRFILDRIFIQHTPNLCIRHWIIVLIVPVMILFGIVIQYTCTGRNYDHRDSWHKFLCIGKKRYVANLKRIRHDYEHNTFGQHMNPDESKRFRYFYRKRRANGDVLSSEYIQNVRQQSSNGVRLTSVINNNANPIVTDGTIPAQKENDSTTTTLTHLI